MLDAYKFNKQELQLIAQCKKHKTIQAIFYHFWVNLSIPEEKFVFVDTIEVIFDDQNRLFFKINEEDNGFNIKSDYNFETEQQQLTEQFQGVLSLKRIDVSAATIWKDKINKPLTSIRAAVDEDRAGGNYLVISFESEALEINYDAEGGLIVEVFEEL